LWQLNNGIIQPANSNGPTPYGMFQQGMDSAGLEGIEGGGKTSGALLRGLHNLIAVTNSEGQIRLYDLP
jgi:hypothetical protein